MQNLAASFPQLPFLGPISSVASGNPAGASNPTTTNANSGSRPDQDAQENGGAGQEQQSQFGMDSANLQQLMLAAASAAANSNVEGNAFQKYYLSQMQSASSTPHIDPGTNPAMGNPAGDMDSGLGQQQSAISQSFFDTLFNPQQSQHPAGMTPQASEMLNSSKMQQMNQNLGNGFGEMTPELLAQIMDMVSGQQQELKPSGHARQMTHGPTHKMSAQSGCSSGDNSTPISPNGQQMNPASSQLFDQLQLLGILGGTSVSNSLNPADLFTSSNSYMNTSSAANSALSQAFNSNNSNSGSDFASLAASLNLNLNGGGASHAPNMDTHNNQAATAAAVQAALLGATSGSFSQANFSGNSPNKSLDSYCEICDKQLCNRYFLKTHKQKKHGIFEDGSTAGSTGSPVKTSFGQSQGSFESDSYAHANSARSTAPTQSHSSVIVSSGQNAGSLDHDSDRHGSGDSSPLAKMPKLSSCSTSSSSSIQHNLMASLMNGTAGVSGNALHALFGGGKSALDFLSSFPGIMGNGHAEQRTPTKSPTEEEQFNVTESGNTVSNACSYCDKEFDSRVNLLQHQILQHGGNSISTTFQRPACGSPLSSSTGATHGGSTSGSSEANLNGNLQSQLGNSFLNNLLPGMPLPFLLPQQLAQFGGDMSSGGVQSPTAQGSQGQTPKLVAKRQYSSTSKNYCDLCKKEVCNKYFLRTHMLKMHNIVIDENKSVIANIDTLEKERSGSISFRCDICQVNMQTRNDLRQHKREAHGLAPTPLLTPPLSGSLQTTPSRKSGIHTALSASGPSMVSQQSQKLMGQRFFGQPVPDNLSDENEQNENDEETKPKIESDENAGTSLAANVEMILNSIAGGKIGAEKALSQVLAQGLASNAQVKKEADGSEDANSMDNNVPSSSASSTFEAANSATSSVSTSTPKCEICGQEFADQVMLKLHHINQHSLGNGNILSLLTQQQQNQLPNDGSDIMQSLTQIALEMAKANHAQNQGSMINNQALAAPVQHTCTHCNRQYKSKLALQNHTKLVHHNFVAKLSPTKKSKRPVISPKKVKKLRSSFTCMKCQRRFSTRAECSEHIIAHLKAEKENENLQNQAFTAPNSQQSLRNTSPAVKSFRSNSFGNGGHQEQDSNNNSASIHACRSLPMERDDEMGEREQIRRMSQPVGIELSRSKPSEFDDNLLCTFIREDLTDEEQDQVLSANHTQLTLSLEMPGAGPTPTSVAGAVGSGSAHPSSSSSSYDDGFLMIDANSEGNDAVDQVVSEIHEERCRRQSHHNIKEEKHSHTPEEQSSDHCEESDTGKMSPENVTPRWSPASVSTHLHLAPPQQCNWPAASAPGVVSQTSPHSGSTSPLSVNLAHTISQMAPFEAYAHPLSSGSSSGTSSTQTTQKPYAHQSFVLKTIHNNNSSSGANNSQLLFDELVAYLPVKAHVQEPVQLTIELHPSPHLDTHVQHL
ncbi:Zinc finger, C2H2 type family protein [Ditylenchus destructor]|uniref:Zinc finger, C2H2 type family protein n=1 Tax=Ditylenchus destructor TaxID=166010 RepID=A0AAD4MWI5_9BILA|nr:Zinc finger, C2H2 type family protein [Ditylenchus destructor]